MNKEEVLKLAQKHGVIFTTSVTPHKQNELLAFANACEKIGMEKAWTEYAHTKSECADASRGAIE